MTLETDAFTTYLAVGNREDLSDVIYNVAPTETPFLTGIAKVNASAVLHEWETDSLASALTSNAVLEGDAITNDAATATVRLSNTCQIQDKVPRVTGTQEVVKKAGRTSEMAYQVVKRTLELRRDMETTVLNNQAENTGDATTARKMGSVPSWIDTSDSNGGGAAATGSLGNTARTDGTQRTFTEALLKTVLQSIWNAGGEPDCITLGSFAKTLLSTFTGNATRFKTAEDKKLVSSIDVYGSDWGDLEVIPNRFQRARDAFIFQKDMWAAAYLRPVSLANIGKTGDSQAKQIIVEWTLEARNEASSGAVWDLSTS